MNLYLISQDVRRGYDVYDSAVVAAETEDDARAIHPDGYNGPYGRSTWCKPAQVKVIQIGTAYPGTPSGVICASFNAG